MDQITPDLWEEYLKKHTQAHILQTLTWGQLKASFNWTPRYLRQGDIGAMVLFRRLPLGMSVAYIPRGPVGEGDWSAFWPAVDSLCQGENAVFLRVEPDIWQPVDTAFIERQLPDFVPSEQSTQPPRTIMIDLSAPEEELLMAMKSKTRYNIRLAARKDVVVQQSSDVALFHHMSLTTGERDAFGIHSLSYYQRAFELFNAQGACVLLIASYQDQPLAGLMAFAHGDTGWYLYGASTNQERNRMPTYLLQWEAIRWAKHKGCQHYDLWGVPDFPETMLEEQFLERSDGLWGVYRFKRGFGGQVQRTIGTWDRIYSPLIYKLYQLWTRRRTSPAA